MCLRRRCSLSRQFGRFSHPSAARGSNAESNSGGTCCARPAAVSLAQFGGAAVSCLTAEFALGGRDAKREMADRRSRACASDSECKSKTAPSLIPIKRQASVVHETPRRQFGRMLAAGDRADNVQRQSRETGGDGRASYSAGCESPEPTSSQCCLANWRIVSSSPTAAIKVRPTNTCCKN